MQIRFEFIGGPQDGQVALGREGEPSDAERYYLFTNRGRIGQRFKVASPYAVNQLAEEGLESDRPRHFQRHYYRVVGRRQRDDEVVVRAQYVRDDA